MRPPLISTDIASSLGSHAMTLDPSRVVADLRELQELTGDENGAQRVAWTDTWERARAWLDEKLPLEHEVDEAGNQWWTLRGRSERAVLIGGDIDSVPHGGGGCGGVYGQGGGGVE